MSDLARIAENLASVRDRIARAAARAGRAADEVTLVGVTKYVEEDRIRALVAAGCTALGENRPQELCAKAESLADLSARWHMIGHLQRNKARRVLPLVEMIHSVDSPRLLETIDRIAEELDRRATVLLEVNISGEVQKHGLQPDELLGLVETLGQYLRVDARGLMAMSGLESGAAGARREFAALRQLRDRAAANCPEGVRLDDLSMGMSGDFEEAVEEGATIVRIGSALFEGLDE